MEAEISADAEALDGIGTPILLTLMLLEDGRTVEQHNLELNEPDARRILIELQDALKDLEEQRVIGRV